VALPLMLAAPAFAQGGPPFRTDDPDTPGNHHWEINFGFVGDRNAGSGVYQVPDVDINYGLGERIQLKYEIPVALSEIRYQPGDAATDTAATYGQVIGGIGESQPGIKWRFYEHHPHDPLFKGRFGTGLLDVIHHRTATTPSATAGDAPGAADAPEQETDFSISTYPQIFLNNPTSAVGRGVVAGGPDFFLPIEVNARIGPIRINGDVGYNFGNRDLAQSWNRGLLIGHAFSDRTEVYAEIYDTQDANTLPAGRGAGQFASGHSKQRETTADIGGRQAVNKAKTLNLLLMGGRSFQTVTASNGQPRWIAYVGLQVLFGR
jgi:hypothetical protein